ncbi:biofilm-dependent modulation protein [Salmonella enterica]|uniref:Biofilm-dependent modulation protein n=2 Tax=Salmonella enterica TaxID=28901 RepID=A0A724LAA7_SALEN|nr:biofilm-dependent modulation protein [Salmonella enterica subsp. enterica serovar Enteritidis]EKC3410717.1 biofilm-dependent modulation protein [Salmonella enterica]EKN5304629.1 biofilm-dependent modulation protein [Salmonella enterica]EKN5402822.1 biofilm-dependent modulation protein [Salmonella enterica]EKN5407300.1 biofilm-dependent modulation protein [Salmonella enterica]
MFTYHSANTSAAQPALVNAIEQGLRAELGVVTEDDILMELTKWVEASDNDILSDIYQQTMRAAPDSVKPAMLYRQP